jgi:hypothetical protein
LPELAQLRRLSTPVKVQAFLDREITYNTEPHGATCYSPSTVLEKRLAHCMEGAMLAAAALRLHGHPPLIVDLEATRDTDHVLAVYRQYGCWGAVAKSNYSGLRFREPVYRTIRELALSYFEDYFNPRREKTLRGYSRPVNLRRFDRLEWMSTKEPLWQIPTYLCEVRHTPLLPPDAERRLQRMDSRLFAAGRLGME